MTSSFTFALVRGEVGGGSSSVTSSGLLGGGDFAGRAWRAWRAFGAGRSRTAVVAGGALGASQTGGAFRYRPCN